MRHKQLVQSLRDIELAQEHKRLESERKLRAIQDAGHRWGHSLAVNTWHTNYTSAIQPRLKKVKSGRVRSDNTADPKFAVVFGQHPIDANGRIETWCTTGATVFNTANTKAFAFDVGARKGFAEGLEKTAAVLAVSVDAYKQLASMHYVHGLARTTALRIAQAGLARFAEFVPMPTEFVQWDVGGTYRHKCRIRFDRPVAIDEYRGGHHRPGVIGELFGRGSSSKSGCFQQCNDTLEFYQDQ